MLDDFEENEITAGGESGYKKVEFINVNNEPIDVIAKDAGDDGLTVTTAGVVDQVDFYAAAADGTPGAKITDEVTPIKYIKVGGKAAGTGSFTLQANGTNGSAFVTVPVTVAAAGHLATATFAATASQVNPIIDDVYAEEASTDKLEVAVDSTKSYTTTTLAGNAIDFKIKAEDQYGKEIPKKFFTVSNADTSDTTMKVTDNDKAGDETTVEKTISIEPAKDAESKEYTVNLAVNAVKNGTQPFASVTTPLSKSVNITVKTALDVKSIRFNNQLSVTETSAAAGTATYDVSGGKAFYVPAKQKDVAYTLSFDALDKDGNVINVPSTTYSSVASATVAHAEGVSGDLATASVDTSDGVVLTADGSSYEFKEGDTISFTLEAADLGLSLPVSLKVSVAEPEVTTDITPVTEISTPDASGKYADASNGVNGTYVDTDGTTKPMVIGVQGVDQYGILRNVDKTTLTYKVLPSTIATFEGANDGIITPKAVGTGEIRITGVGTGVTVPLTITQADVDAKKPTVSTAPKLTMAKLTYDSTAQALLDDGTTGAYTNGTIKYKVVGPGIDAPTWGTDAKGTKAGTYSVYYKVEGNTGYSDIPETLLGTVEIKKDTLEGATVAGGMGVSSEADNAGKVTIANSWVTTPATVTTAAKVGVTGTWTITEITGDGSTATLTFTPTNPEDFEGGPVTETGVSVSTGQTRA